MILVRSKGKGFVGLLISAQAIPVKPKMLVPGQPKLELEWVGVVLVDNAWVIRSLTDLIPVVPDNGEEIQQ